MAQEIEVKVKVVTDQAVNSVDKLGNAFDQTAKDAKEAQEVFAKAGNGVKVEESISGLKQLKRELKNVAVGSEEFKIIYNQIDDLEDKLKSAKNVSSDWVDSLEGAGGGLGMLGGAINKAKVATQSWGGALKATGIGILVGLLGGLVAAFSENESAMKKIQPLFDGLKKITFGIFRAVEPLVDVFMDLAMKALPYVADAVGAVYSGMMAYFKFLKEAGGGAMQILKGVFTLDSNAISAGIDQVKGSFSKAGDTYKKSMKAFGEGSKELTETEKAEAEKREENRKAAQEKREAAEQKAKEKKAEGRAKELEAQKAFDDETLKQIAEFNRAKIDVAVQNDIEEAERKAKSLEDISAVVDAIDAKELSNVKILSDEKIKIAQAEAQQKADIQNAEFALATGAINFLKEIGGKNKAIQRAAIIAENAVGIGKMIIANNAANIGALATPQAILTSGASAIPVIAMNNITTGLGIATTIASTAKALSALGGGSAGGAPALKGGGGGGGGISTPASIPVNPNVVSDSGVNQLAKSLSAVPLKTYVVAKEVTSQQSLDRNITDTATLG